MLDTLQWQIKRAGNRPKVHSMRGPRPKWRAKHAQVSTGLNLG